MSDKKLKDYAKEQVADEEKQIDQTDAMIGAGVSLLIAKEPVDRGEAFKELKKADLTGTGKWFNSVMLGYQNETGIELQKSAKSKKEANKAEAMKWAHNANAAEVEHQVATGGVEESKFWAAWQLKKEGKWPEIDIDKTFKPHFKEIVEVNKDALAVAIKTLNTVKPKTRGEAYAALKIGDTSVNARVYIAAVADYEETNKTTLSKSERAMEVEAINAKVHAMSADDVRVHIGSIDKPDTLFWKAWANAKEGAWKGYIKREDFTPLFSNARGQSGQARDKGSPKQQETANVEMDDDIPF